MKDDILDNSIKHITTQLEQIIKSSEAISNANVKIKESVDLILYRHLETVKNKINDFKINRIITKL